MSATKTCPECGVRVPTDAPLGLCPRCLMSASSSSETATYRPVEKPEVAATNLPAIAWTEILRTVRELDLVEAEDLDRLASVAGDDPSQLARMLVQAKKLTP